MGAVCVTAVALGPAPPRRASTTTRHDDTHPTTQTESHRVHDEVCHALKIPLVYLSNSETLQIMRPNTVATSHAGQNSSVSRKRIRTELPTKQDESTEEDKKKRIRRREQEQERREKREGATKKNNDKWETQTKKKRKGKR